MMGHRKKDFIKKSNVNIYKLLFYNDVVICRKASSPLEYKLTYYVKKFRYNSMPN